MKYSASQLLAKGLEILNLFLIHSEEMTLAEISQLSGINKSTVHRIVSTLVSYGYLNQSIKRGKYSLGTIYLSFSGIIKSRSKLRSIALPYIFKMSQLVDEPVVMAYKNEFGSLYTETFHGESQKHNLLSIGLDEASGTPLHSTCSGKIVLADMSSEELKYFFNNTNLIRYTRKTIINIKDMEKHLVKIRRDGIAFDDEESSLGVRGVAAGIRDVDENLWGTIAVVAPSVRLSKTKMRKLVPDIKKYALAISKELGFKVDS